MAIQNEDDRGSRRRGRAAAALVAGAVLAIAGLADVAPTAAESGHPAAFLGQLTLATGQVFPSGHPYDVASDAAGTAYVGWISSTTSDPDRSVHLCTLPIGATSCSGGVQTVAAPDLADDLFVVLNGDTVYLYWHHDVANAQNGAIAEAFAVNGLNLGTPQDVVSDGPGLHQLLDTQLDPYSGDIWTVSYAGPPARSVTVRGRAIGPAGMALPTPYEVSYAQLAFTGYTYYPTILAVEKNSSIGTAVYYATENAVGTTWNSFHAVAHTWAVGTNAVLKWTHHGLRLVTAVDNATYRQAISRWTGTVFTSRQLTADTNSCTPSSHDGATDDSGRLLDVAWECDKLTVTNYADALHAAIVRLPVVGTTTHAPQIASGALGIAGVAYSMQSPDADVLRFARVRLPDSTHTASKSGAGGKVTVTGPRTCLPPVNVRIGWAHHAAASWTFKSGGLRLDGALVPGSTLDGATLTPGDSYTLKGTAVFGRGSDRNTVRASIGFMTCGSGTG